VASNNMVVLLF